LKWYRVCSVCLLAAVLLALVSVMASGCKGGPTEEEMDEAEAEAAIEDEMVPPAGEAEDDDDGYEDEDEAWGD